MTPLPRLLSVATAVPRYVLHQEEVKQRVRVVFAECLDIIERLMPVYGNAGIETRYSCVPVEWYEEDHGWTDRNRLYIDNAVDLLERAARTCLDRTGIGIRDINGIVAVSTSGIATPSLDALLIERLGMRRDVLRLPIFGLGCAGGVIGLARAATLAQAVPNGHILFLVVEPCALTFRRNDLSKSNIVATALFGDGAAAALLGCESDGPVLTASGEHTWLGTLDVMGWEVEENGLRPLFSRDIPTLIRERFREALDGFLAKCGFVAADIDQFICHPGGAKVLDALEEVLGLEPMELHHSRATLRDYGNMSAATVMFVLERTLYDGGLGRRSLLTALGPGFTAAFLMIEDPAVTHLGEAAG